MDMQKSWLSPRVLNYGVGALKWKCVGREAFQGQKRNEVRDFMTIITSDRRRFFPPWLGLQGQAATPLAGTSAGIKGLASSVDIIDIWKTLVSQYTSKDLTHSGDKFPAISGMAAEFGSISGYQYWTGLWKHDLLSQLLWQHSGTTRALPLYRAPSWSWAAVEGEGSFRIEASVDYPKKPTQRISLERKVTVNKCSVQLKDTIQRFGEVTHGELTLSGPVRTLIWSDIRHNFDFFAAGAPNY
jgi:hypothetical protein